MILVRWFRKALALSLAATLAGCLPTGSGQDEEKEAHFQNGRARVNGMDYSGAIEAFQKALEVNPHSAAAHFELGWLFADKQPDPAAAIYHYQQYLALRPKADNAETIRQHILGLKQDLAKSVLPLPSTPGVQRQVEDLMDKNRQLQDQLVAWQTYYASRGLVPPTNLPNVNLGSARIPAPASGAGMLSIGVTPPTGPTTPRSPQSNAPRQTVVGRTHKVLAGETPSAIAKKYSVKLEALLAANPGLNPKRMQVGQTLNVPAS